MEGKKNFFNFLLLWGERPEWNFKIILTQDSILGGAPFHFFYDYKELKVGDGWGGGGVGLNNVLLKVVLSLDALH